MNSTFGRAGGSDGGGVVGGGVVGGGIVGGGAEGLAEGLGGGAADFLESHHHPFERSTTGGRDEPCGGSASSVSECVVHYPPTIVPRALNAHL